MGTNDNYRIVLKCFQSGPKTRAEVHAALKGQLTAEQVNTELDRAIQDKFLKDTGGDQLRLSSFGNLLITGFDTIVGGAIGIIIDDWDNEN